MIDEFDRRKKGIHIIGSELYQPENKWADGEGRLDLEPDIKDLVLDINRYPSAFSGICCQGHFHVLLPQYVTKHTPGFLAGLVKKLFPDLKVGVGLSEDEKLFLSGSGILFAQEYPNIDPNQTGFMYYKTPYICLYIKKDSAGNQFYEALKLWEFNDNIETRETDCMWSPNISLVSKQIESQRNTRVYSFDEIKRLNQDRLKQINSLHEIVQNELRKARSN